MRRFLSAPFAARPALLAMGLLLAGLSGARAHPMGNFSVGQYSGLSLGPAGLKVRYVVDLAEVPTTSLLPELGLSVGQPLTEAAAETYRRGQAPAWCRQLEVTLDGQPLSLVPGVGSCVVTTGSGGLPTLRMETECVVAWPLNAAGASLPAGSSRRLVYKDSNYRDLVGLKEIIARCEPGVRCVSSTVPEVDVSAALTRYVTDSRVVPPQVRQAEVVFQVLPASGLAKTRTDPRVCPSAIPPTGPAAGRIGGLIPRVPPTAGAIPPGSDTGETGVPVPMALFLMGVVAVVSGRLGARLIRAAPTATPRSR